MVAAGDTEQVRTRGPKGVESGAIGKVSSHRGPPWAHAASRGQKEATRGGHRRGNAERGVEKLARKHDK